MIGAAAPYGMDVARFRETLLALTRTKSVLAGDPVRHERAAKLLETSGSHMTTLWPEMSHALRGDGDALRGVIHGMQLRAPGARPQDVQLAREHVDQALLELGRLDDTIPVDAASLGPLPVEEITTPVRALRPVGIPEMTVAEHARHAAPGLLEVVSAVGGSGYVANLRSAPLATARFADGDRPLVVLKYHAGADGRGRMPEGQPYLRYERISQMEGMRQPLFLSFDARQASPAEMLAATLQPGAFPEVLSGPDLGGRYQLVGAYFRGTPSWEPAAAAAETAAITRGRAQLPA